MTGGMGRAESTGRGLGRDVGRKNYLVSVARTALLELGRVGSTVRRREH